MSSSTIARKFILPLLGLTGGCAWSSPPAAPPAPVAITASRSVTESSVRRILTTLAHDSMEGRRTGSPGEYRTTKFIAAEMRSIGLTPAGDSGYFQFVPFASGGARGINLLDSFAALDTIPESQRIIGRNVIGVIRGTDPVLRDQIVVIGAHHDHVGIRAHPSGDSIFNGADDDASGVTAILEIARAIMGSEPPKRTIVFLSTTGEEQGILGTRWYVNHPAYPISQTVADLQFELIGRPDSLVGGAGKAWLTGFSRSTMGEMLQAASVPIVADPYPQMNFFERSDNIVFARLGIPAHTLSSYNLHTDYHAPGDDVDRIDFAHMAAVIRASVSAARLLADGPVLQWKEGGRPAAR